jgi:hypothetical protein
VPDPAAADRTTSPEGTVHFYDDIDDRDAAVAAAPNAPFSLIVPGD